MGLTWDASSLFKGFAELEVRTNHRLNRYGEVWAKRLEERAKKNAKWQDETGKARDSITGFYYWRGKHLIVGIQGGGGDAPYFPYLEFAHKVKPKVRLSRTNKRKGAKSPPVVKEVARYSTIFPTLRRNAHAMFKGLDRIIES